MTFVRKGRRLILKKRARSWWEKKLRSERGKYLVNKMNKIIFCILENYKKSPPTFCIFAIQNLLIALQNLAISQNVPKISQQTYTVLQNYSSRLGMELYTSLSSTGIHSVTSLDISWVDWAYKSSVTSCIVILLPRYFIVDDDP
jgi:hypothetical protein